MPKRSTSTNLMCLVSSIFNNMERGSQVDTIYTDFKAAFDSISLACLLSKLEKLGIGDPLLSWLKSYLYGRSYKVRVENSFSEPFIASSGVPQGSVLSPLLFILFINDCVNVLPPDGCLLYADDIKIFLPVTSLTDCARLQDYIDCFNVWCNSNGLSLSPDKCCVISYGRSSNKIEHDYVLCDTVLNRVTVTRDLGVWIDEKLSFQEHIEITLNKANKMLGLIIRMSSEITDPMCLKSLYCCWVRPILENASVVWWPAGLTLVDRIERIQRKFTRVAIRRFLGRSDRIPSYPIRCRLLGLETLRTRIYHIQSYFIACLLSNDLDVPALLSSIPIYAPSRRLRDRPPLLIPSRQTRHGQNDPFLRALSAFNDSYLLFDFNVPVSQFRSRLRESSSLMFP